MWVANANDGYSLTTQWMPTGCGNGCLGWSKFTTCVLVTMMGLLKDLNIVGQGEDTTLFQAAEYRRPIQPFSGSVWSWMQSRNKHMPINGAM